MKRLNFTLFCAFVLLCVCVTNSQAQKQIIGAFPYMDGGFENQSSGNLGTALSASAWSAQVQTASIGSSIITTGGGRSGPTYAHAFFNTGFTQDRELQSPQSTTPADGPAASTQYTVQFFMRNSVSVPSFQYGVSTNGILTLSPSATTTIAVNADWHMQTATVTTAATAVTTTGIGFIRMQGGNFDVDDFVIYPGAADATAPAVATTPGTSNIDNSSITTSWAAPSGGVDGGGYVVLRYTADPTGATAPKQNGIYTIGNTIGTGTVAYIGTATSFTDINLLGGTQYYYAIYTVDKAFNYSSAVVTSATTTAAGLVPSATSLSFSNTGLATNSVEQNFTVSGSGLTDNLVVTAPAGFLVSTTSGSGYNNSVTIAPTAGTVNSTIYAVFHPVTAGNQSDNIVISSTGQTSASIAVSGYGSAMYQTKQSGDWSDPATWQYYNGTSWVDATVSPANNEVSVTVQNTHSITVSSGISVSQVTVNGTVTVNPATTLTIVHGTAPADLVVGNGGTLLNQGTVTIGSAATWEIQNGATYIHNTSTATPSTLTIDNGSTFIYRDAAFSPSVSGIAFYNFSLETTGTYSPNTSAAFTVNGKLSIGTNVVYATTSAITVNGDLDVKGTLNLNNSLALAANKTFTIYPNGVLTILGGSQNVNVGSGTFLILSDATGTGSIGNSPGHVNGNVTVQRYIPAHGARAYTLVSSPVNSPAIYNSWQEAGASTTDYGTQISGASAGNGFDFASAAGIASVYNYNDNNTPGTKWVGLTNTNSTNLSAGTGYLLFVRGDRMVGAGSGAPQATTLRATGTLTAGTVNFATAGGTAGTAALLSGANKYSLIANPYVAPIQWTSLTKSNLSGSFTVYDPNLVSFVTSDGTTVSPNTSQQQANVLQSGQAFFIQNNTSGNAPALTMNETNKITTVATGTGNTVFGMEVPAAQLNINFYKADSSFADGAVAVFNSSYNKMEDEKDATKFTNFSETISFAENNSRFLSIDARPLPQGNDTLFVDMKQMVANTAYSIAIDATGFNNSNLSTATLVDKVTGLNTPIDPSTKTSYQFTTTAASEAGRLFIVLGGKPVVSVPATADSSNTNTGDLQVALLGNPVKDKIILHYTAKQAGNTTIKLIGSNGQSVSSISLGQQQQGTVTIPVAQYAGGLYLVQVTVGDHTVMNKVVKQ